MSFLAGLLADLAEWGLTKVWGSITAWIAKLKNRSANQTAAEQSVEPLKNATTSDQIDKATDDTLSGL